jgi:cbb3-type cytochrome oxidase cytochrome c subunit/cytochrome c553
MRWGPVSQRAEYLHDQPHLLGTRRIGPDLARVGGKFADGWHWAHHLRPRNVAPETVMPSFHWLYQRPDDPEYVRRSERVRRFIATYDVESRRSGVLVGDVGKPGGEVRPEKDGVVGTRLIDALTGETIDDVADTFHRVWGPYRNGDKPVAVRPDGKEFVFDVAEPAAALLLTVKELRVAAPNEPTARAMLEARLRQAVDDLFAELDLNGDGVLDASDARRQPTRELIDLTAYLQRLGTSISIEDWRGGYFAVGSGGSGAIEDTPDNRAAGKAIYERHCIGCHGPRGDGRGVAAEYLDGFIPEKLGDNAAFRASLGAPKRDRQPAPRDLRTGRFKFRSTPDGSPPTDDDLLRTVGRGLRGTAMPGFHELPDRDRRLVVDYIKSFSDRFSPIVAGRADGAPNAGTGGVRDLALGAVVFHGQEFTLTYLGEDRWSIVGRLDRAVRHTAAAKTGRPVTVAGLGMTLIVFGSGFAPGDAFTFTTYSAFHDPRRKTAPRADVLEAHAPPPSFDLLARGRRIFHGAEAGCAKCHGPAGRGDGPARKTEPMFHESGFRTAPADFGDLYGIRSGVAPEDLYRTLMTGVSGTPMAQFAGALPGEYDRWAVVHYVLHLRRQSLAERYWKSQIPPGTPADKLGGFDRFQPTKLFPEPP